jgi:hypothetical protein
MPNYCWNKLIVRGPRNDLDDIAENRLSFQHYLPCPQDAQDPIEWCYENWDTKWEAWNVEVVRNTGNYLEITYTTAWCPPHKILLHLLNTYPKCWMKNTFDEEGGNAGVWIGRMMDGAPHVQSYDWEELCMEENMCEDFSR